MSHMTPSCVITRRAARTWASVCHLAAKVKTGSRLGPILRQLPVFTRGSDVTLPEACLLVEGLRLIYSQGSDLFPDSSDLFPVSYFFRFPDNLPWASEEARGYAATRPPSDSSVRESEEGIIKGSHLEIMKRSKMPECSELRGPGEFVRGCYCCLVKHYYRTRDAIRWSQIHGDNTPPSPPPPRLWGHPGH